MKKGLGGINMVKSRKNMAWLLDGGCEVQSNLIIYIFRAIRVSSLSVRLRKGGRSLKRSHPSSTRIGVFIRCVVRDVLTTINGWWKLALKTLVYRGGGINISGCRGM